MSNQNAPQKLKIAMVIDVFEPVRNGTVVSTARFAAGLRAAGHEVTIISNAEAGPHNIHVPNYNIPYFDKRYIQPMEMTFAKPSKQLLRKILPEFDCVHIHLPFVLGHAAATICKELGVPCVATHHVQAEWLSNAGITWQRAVTFGYKVFLKTYNKCATLICPSQKGLDDIKSYGLTKPSIVISNGVLEEYKPMPSVRKQEWQDKFVLFSVGRLANEKAHNITIEAIKKSKFKDKIQLVIAGTGPQRDNLQKLAVGLPNKVEFILDFISQHELIELYSDADLFIHSGSNELEGMVCSEAIACGAVPIIAQHHLSASEQFALDARSLYEFGNAAELAQKIDAWLECPESIAVMKPQYIEYAKKWSFATSLQKMLGVYRSAMVDTTQEHENCKG